jgi:hypothetical protein
MHVVQANIDTAHQLPVGELRHLGYHSHSQVGSYTLKVDLQPTHGASTTLRYARAEGTTPLQ